MNLSISNTSSAARLRYQEQVAELTRRNQERLASGRRIATAADDSAGLAIARRLEAAVRSADQGSRNLADGQSLVRTAEAALQSSQDAVGRMRELAVQAQNGTLSDSDRATIQEEYDQLAQQLDQTARGTRFGDRALLDGSVTGDDAITFTDGDEAGETRLELQDAGAAALGVAGRSVSDPNTLSALDDASAMLASERAALGAADNSLSARQEQLAAERASAEEARSRIEDVDVAREVASATRNQILSGLQVQSQRIAEQSRSRLVDLLN